MYTTKWRNLKRINTKGKKPDIKDEYYMILLILNFRKGKTIVIES